MINQMQEFVADQTSALASQVSKMRKESVESVREVVVGSAENLKALPIFERMSGTFLDLNRGRVALHARPMISVGCDFLRPPG